MGIARFNLFTARSSNHLLFVKVVLYCYQAGIPRYDLPTCFGDWKNVCRYLRYWCESSVIERIFGYWLSIPTMNA
ncbi:transposase [Komagataeibacter melomenusus]